MLVFVDFDTITLAIRLQDPFLDILNELSDLQERDDFRGDAALRARGQCATLLDHALNSATHEEKHSDRSIRRLLDGVLDGPSDSTTSATSTHDLNVKFDEAVRKLKATPRMTRDAALQLRRNFSLSHHPDRLDPQHRAQAERQLAIVNALVDDALAIDH